MQVVSALEKSGESPNITTERSHSEAKESSAAGNSSSRLSTASPSPVSSLSDKRGLNRRFSYTSTACNRCDDI